MKFLRAVLVMAVALALQTVLGRFWPASHRYVDLLLLPVVWYAIAGSQRAGMLVGCGAGLLQDAWFETGTFGLNGFKRTLLGWFVGGLGTRFDLNHLPGQFVVASLAALVDSLFGVMLRHMLDRTVAPLRIGELLLRSLTTGVLIVVIFAVVGAVRRRRRKRGLA